MDFHSGGHRFLVLVWGRLEELGERLHMMTQARGNPIQFSMMHNNNRTGAGMCKLLLPTFIMEDG